MRLPILIYFGLGFASTFLLQAQTNEGPREGTIGWYVAKAKAEGKKSIRLPVRQGLPVQLSQLEQALRAYMIVVAIPIASATSSPNQEDISTWYKLQISEFVKAHPRPEVPQAFPIPTGLKPIEKNEFIVRVAGGTMTVDNIAVTEDFPSAPGLTIGASYLLFILPDESGVSGTLRAGRNAVFRVSASGQIDAMSPDHTLFQEDVIQKSSASLHIFRQLSSSVQ